MTRAPGGLSSIFSISCSRSTIHFSDNFSNRTTILQLDHSVIFLKGECMWPILVAVGLLAGCYSTVRPTEQDADSDASSPDASETPADQPMADTQDAGTPLFCSPPVVPVNQEAPNTSYPNASTYHFNSPIWGAGDNTDVYVSVERGRFTARAEPLMAACVVDRVRQAVGWIRNQGYIHPSTPFYRNLKISIETRIQSTANPENGIQLSGDRISCDPNNPSAVFPPNTYDPTVVHEVMHFLGLEGPLSPMYSPLRPLEEGRAEYASSQVPTRPNLVPISIPIERRRLEEVSRGFNTCLDLYETGMRDARCDFSSLRERQNCCFSVFEGLSTFVTLSRNGNPFPVQIRLLLDNTPLRGDRPEPDRLNVIVEGGGRINYEIVGYQENTFDISRPLIRDDFMGLGTFVYQPTSPGHGVLNIFEGQAEARTQVECLDNGFITRNVIPGEGGRNIFFNEYRSGFVADPPITPGAPILSNDYWLGTCFFRFLENTYGRPAVSRVIQTLQRPDLDGVCRYVPLVSMMAGTAGTSRDRMAEHVRNFGMDPERLENTTRASR